ncbi:alpha/beta hydrolase [Brevibacillus fluminis]|uniref:Alpha/beta hydrolase n=1 Tax=Brevibacillus fluminis TaxID=511487 RepID=A0A3M8D971_9BACL|nr:alpha/beta hydrolase [Brevibacillus fluminis]RNB84498.1 alpha/beta hydrolase [Brevibacillus fluminis]
MTQRSEGQKWVLDIALALGGFDALHPEAKPTMEQLGHDHTDFDKVFAMVKSGAMLPKAWATIASQAQERAEHYEKKGFQASAIDLYRRAAVMWGRAQYSFFADDPRKAIFRGKCNDCVASISRLSNQRVQRIVLDFEGKQIYAILHLPAGDVQNAPAVILAPGMDMIKEDYLFAAQQYYTSRGIVALSIEGPGQGETVSNGLKVDLTNYDRAASCYIDFLSQLPEVDSTRIGFFGISMGGYWGMRAAAHDPRIGALVTFEGVYGEFETIFNRAQPSFKANFMYMSGFHDEETFDVQLGSKMKLWDIARKIKCPIFMGIGEFDELTRLEEALALYELLHSPKEMRVYENEFHPLGGVAAEIFRFGAEWAERALNGEFASDRDERAFVHRNGRVTEGSAAPTWWLGAKPIEIEIAEKTYTTT